MSELTLNTTFWFKYIWSCIQLCYLYIKEDVCIFFVQIINIREFPNCSVKFRDCSVRHSEKLVFLNKSSIFKQMGEDFWSNGVLVESWAGRHVKDKQYPSHIFRNNSIKKNFHYFQDSSMNKNTVKRSFPHWALFHWRFWLLQNFFCLWVFIIKCFIQ